MRCVTYRLICVDRKNPENVNVVSSTLENLAVNKAQMLKRGFMVRVEEFVYVEAGKLVK